MEGSLGQRKNTISNKINLLKSHFHPLKNRLFGGSSLIDPFKHRRGRKDPPKRRVLRGWKWLSKKFILLGIVFFQYPWIAFHQFSTNGESLLYGIMRESIIIFIWFWFLCLQKRLPLKDVPEKIDFLTILLKLWVLYR